MHRQHDDFLGQGYRLCPLGGLCALQFGRLCSRVLFVDEELCPFTALGAAFIIRGPYLLGNGHHSESWCVSPIYLTFPLIAADFLGAHELYEN
jgi:hypothetical protein